MLRKEMKRFKTMFLVSSLFLASIPFGCVMAQADVSEAVYMEESESDPEKEYTEDLKFLTYCDMDELTAWDNSIATMTDDEADEIKAFVETNILSGDETDYEKAELIFNWIIHNISYAYDMDIWISADPYYVFQSGIAVCGGYSNLYKAMLSLVDVPAVVITGDTPAGGHAWNAIYADNRWFYADSTWGAAYGGGFFDEGIAHFSTEHTTIRLEGVSIETEDGLVIGYDQGIAVIGTNFETTTVNVPETFEEFDVTSVSYTLFNRMYGVTTLNLSKNINAIDTQVSAPALKAINVDAENETYASREGVLFTKDFREVLIYPDNKQSESFTLPKETVTFDMKETFANSYLVNIYAEEGNALYSSFDGALYNKEQTESVFVPAGKGEIRIPSDAVINDLAFANVDTSRITIYAEENSPAHQYAQTNNITYEIVKPSNAFEDVDASQGYYSAVLWAVENNITSGYNENTFGTNDPCTRAQIVTFLWRAMGKPSAAAEVAFDDVKEGEYYYQAVQWAVENEITEGYNKNTFGTNDPCTRAQIVTFLWRANGEEAPKTERNPFDDVQAAEYYYKAVLWAVENNITKGITENTFAPYADCSRAEAVTFLYRVSTK